MTETKTIRESETKSDPLLVIGTAAALIAAYPAAKEIVNDIRNRLNNDKK